MVYRVMKGLSREEMKTVEDWITGSREVTQIVGKLLVITVNCLETSLEQMTFEGGSYGGLDLRAIRWKLNEHRGVFELTCRKCGADLGPRMKQKEEDSDKA